MKHVPDFVFSVFPEDTFQEKMTEACRQLAQCRREGNFSGFDGKPLYYEYFQVQNSRGAVVLLHGLSEFTGKYHEFAWYLLNQGYDVFLYDQRGHGKSCRLTDRIDLLHVDAFGDYRKDLECFLEQVVRKATDGPLYLYGHSMGGAVAVQYLIKHPGVFSKAVLSAPMIEPLTGSVPPAVARWGLLGYCLVGKGKQKFWGSGEFDPAYPFSRSQDGSLARFQWNMQARLADERLRTTPMSIRWVQQSVTLKGKLTRKGVLRKLQTPILMLCAEKDRMVSAGAQERFAKNCPVCRKVVVPGSTHSMLWGTQQTIEANVHLVLDHFC